MMNLAADQRATCLYCLLIVEESEATKCPGCGAPHHEECWLELGGCTTYGCTRMVETRKADEQVITYWGASEKKCPVCAEAISVAALECQFCRTSFEDIRPMSPEDLIKPDEEEWIKKYRRGAVCLVLFSAIGCTSAFTFLIGVSWLLLGREKLKQVPATRGLILIALGIDVVYAVVLPLGWLIFTLKGIQ